MSLLHLHQATLKAGRQLMGPFTLAIRPGERIAILGPSGAGKSSLLKLMTRELRAASGEVRLGGQPLDDWSLPEMSLRRAVLPQSHQVAFGLDVALVISLGRVARPRDPHLDDIIERAAHQARATHLLGRRFDTLSGGEMARVQLARVFAQLWDAEHGLVLVDEPVAALDPGLQLDMLDALHAYCAERGHALVAVLHDINHALQGFERMLLIKGGQLVAEAACHDSALPQLEALYGVALERTRNAQGDVFVAPVRRLARQEARA